MNVLKDLISVACKNCRAKEYLKKEEYDKLTQKEKDYCVICTYRSPSIADIYSTLLKD